MLSPPLLPARFFTSARDLGAAGPLRSWRRRRLPRHRGRPRAPRPSSGRRGRRSRRRRGHGGGADRPRPFDGAARASGGARFASAREPRRRGRSVWDVTDAEISKAFRKRSLAVRCRQTPARRPKQAFDKLNDAVRALRDPIRKGEALRRFADRAFKEKCRADPISPARQEGAERARTPVDFSADILRQQREHRARVEEQLPEGDGLPATRTVADEKRANASGGDDDDDGDKRRASSSSKAALGRGRGRGRVERDFPGRTQTTPGWRAPRAREPRRARTRARQRPGSSSSELEPYLVCRAHSRSSCSHCEHIEKGLLADTRARPAEADGVRPSRRRGSVQSISPGS